MTQRNRNWLILIVAATAYAWLIGLGTTRAGAAELLDFTADWCKPCQAMKPIVAKVKARGFTVREINIDQQPQLKAQYRVGAIPCFVAMDGQREIDRQVGATTEQRLVAMLTPRKPAPQFRMRGRFDPQFLQQATVEANRQRYEIAVNWLGGPLAEWPVPAEVELVPTNNHGGGSTSFAFDQGCLIGPLTGTWQGTQEALIKDVIPHEVWHLVMASHFRQPVPRWADEGGATTVEQSPTMANINRQILLQALHGAAAFPTNKLLAMKEYPTLPGGQPDMPKVQLLYAQGHSVSAFLIEANGPEGFVAFLEDSLSSGVNRALQDNYEITSTDELQQSWLEWVRVGSPRAPHEVGFRGARRGCHCWRPLRRLWERRPGFIIPKFRRQMAAPPQPSPSVPQENPQPPMVNLPQPPATEPGVVVVGPGAVSDGTFVERRDKDGNLLLIDPAVNPPDVIPGPSVYADPKVDVEYQQAIKRAKDLQEERDKLKAALDLANKHALAEAAKPAAHDKSPEITLPPIPPGPIAKRVEGVAAEKGGAWLTTLLVGLGLPAGPAGIAAGLAASAAIGFAGYKFRGWLGNRGHAKIGARLRRVRGDEEPHRSRSQSAARTSRAAAEILESLGDSPQAAVVERVKLRLQKVPVTNLDHKHLVEAMRREVEEEPNVAPHVQRILKTFDLLRGQRSQQQTRSPEGGGLGWEDKDPTKGVL